MRDQSTSVKLFLVVCSVSLSAFGQATNQEPAVFDHTLYVNPGHASASDNNAGTSTDAPLATLSKAFGMVSNNTWTGSARIVAWPGVYRENVSLWHKSLSNFTFEKAPNTDGYVIISGADVYSDWTQSGGHWVHSWNYDWGLQYKPPAPPSGVYPAGYDAAFPGVYQRRELMLVDGAWMIPVGSLGELAEGTFYVDEVNDKIHLNPPAGTDMNAALVEVPVRNVGAYENHDKDGIFDVIFKGDLLVMRGIAVRHSASMFMTCGAVVHWMEGCHVVIEDCDFSYNGGVGLHLFRTGNVTLRNVKANYNGERGMGLTGYSSSADPFLENVLFANCEWVGNNWRYKDSEYVGFWDASGIKLVPRLRNITIDSCYAADNYSDGIWFDWHNYELIIRNTIMENNHRAGLTIEASTHARLDGEDVVTATVDNCTIKNNETGLFSYGSRNIHIENSSIYGNDGGQGGQISVGGDSRVVFGEAQRTTGWRIVNSAIFATEKTQQLFRFWAYATLPQTPSHDLFTTLHSDSNMWYHPSQQVVFPSSDPQSNGAGLTFDQWQTQTGNDQHSTWGVPAGIEGFSPNAVISGTFDGASLPRTLSFSGTRSTDANGTLTKYLWHFGDGTTATGSAVQHTYTAAGRYRITLVVVDDEGLSDTSHTTVPIDDLSSPNGSVLLERWVEVPGGSILDIPVDTEPDERYLHDATSFSTTNEDHYAVRMSGYLFPPTTGEYSFWITSDDQSQFFLSANENALEKELVVFVPEWAQGEDYSKYPSQKSAPVHLQADGKYFFEILFKEGEWGDHVSLVWTTPGASQPQAIAANCLGAVLPDGPVALSPARPVSSAREARSGHIDYFDLNGRLMRITRAARYRGNAHRILIHKETGARVLSRKDNITGREQ